MNKTRNPRRVFAVLGVLLAVVCVSAMVISYATLIDVVRMHGLPLPELFPVIVDVGTVAMMIAAAQFTVYRVQGRWLAYVIFMVLSVVSICANALHALKSIGPDASPVAAVVLAAIPPITLLSFTHVVMMLLAARSRFETVTGGVAETTESGQAAALVTGERGEDAGSHAAADTPQATAAGANTVVPERLRGGQDTATGRVGAIQAPTLEQAAAEVSAPARQPRKNTVLEQKTDVDELPLEILEPATGQDQDAAVAEKTGPAASAKTAGQRRESSVRSPRQMTPARPSTTGYADNGVRPTVTSSKTAREVGAARPRMSNLAVLPQSSPEKREDSAPVLRLVSKPEEKPEEKRREAPVKPQVVVGKAQAKPAVDMSLVAELSELAAAYAAEGRKLPTAKMLSSLTGRSQAEITRALKGL